VEVVVGASYAGTGEALRQGRVDLAYLGPVSYILQRRHANLEPFARPTHAGTGPTFQAVIIVPADSPTAALGELRGRDVAFGDLASTSGTWVPRHMLLEAGLVADRDYTRRTLGAHDAVARAVAARQAAAGALSRPVFERLIAEHQLDRSAVRVLAESLPIPEYMWVFRAELDRELRAMVRSAFLELRDLETLREYRAESFIPAVDPDVDRVRIWMEAILQTRLTPTALPWTPNEANLGWRRSDETTSGRSLPQ
jgi:phosphonate transport system substrate-binding protein